MASQFTQISATVSKETKKLLDDYARRRGVKKSFIIEEALRRHLADAGPIPEEFLLSPVVRLSAESIQTLTELLESPPPPTKAMRTLLRARPKR